MERPKGIEKFFIMKGFKDLSSGDYVEAMGGKEEDDTQGFPFCSFGCPHLETGPGNHLQPSGLKMAGCSRYGVPGEELVHQYYSPSAFSPYPGTGKFKFSLFLRSLSCRTANSEPPRYKGDRIGWLGKLPQAVLRAFDEEIDRLEEQWAVQLRHTRQKLKNRLGEILRKGEGER